MSKKMPKVKPKRPTKAGKNPAPGLFMLPKPSRKDKNKITTVNAVNANVKRTSGLRKTDFTFPLSPDRIIA